MSYHLFTQEECDFIMDNYQNCTVEQLAYMMSGLFEHHYTAIQIKNKVRDLQIRKRNLKKNFGTYTPEMIEWLKEHYNTVRFDELTKRFNQTFDVDYTKSAVWHKVNRIVEGGIVRDEHKFIARTKWTTEIIEWVKEHYNDDSYNRLAIKLNETFNVKVTSSSLEHKIHRLGLKKDKELIKYNVLPNRFSFQKGHIPASKKPLGYERTHPNGYIWIKVAEPDVFRAKHRVIYEQHHGPIPPGYKVTFVDGNKSNFDIDNLVLVTSAEFGMINLHNLRFAGNIEATKCGINIARIMIRRGQLAKR